MILRSVELESFGPFIDKNFEFRRGMNLVTGPNEAGKSTLLEAIPAILFGCHDKKRFHPWARGGHCAASLRLESQQTNVFIGRDIGSDHVELRQADDLYREHSVFSAVVSDVGHPAQQLEYRHQLQHLLGLDDEGLFRASLFVGQGEFARDASDISTLLRTLVCGFTQHDSLLVQHALQDDYLAITNESPWHGLKTAPRELEVIQEALATLHSQREQHQLIALQLEDLRRQIASHEQQLSQDRAEYEQGCGYLAWIQKQWPGNVVSEPAGAKPWQQECRQLEKILDAAGLPTTIPEDLPRLLAEADDVRSELIARHQEMIPLRSALAAVVLPRWRRPLLLSFLVMVALVGGRFFYPQVLSLLAGLGGVSLCAVWGRFVYRYQRGRGEQKQIQQQLAAVELRREEDRSRLRCLDDEFEQHGLSSSAVEIIKFQKLLEFHAPVLQRLCELRQQHATECRVTDGDGDSDLLPNAAQDSGHLCPEDLPDAQQKLEQLGSRIKKDEVALLALLRQEAVLTGRLEGVASHAEHEQQLQQRARALEERKQVLYLAYTLLQESIEDFYQQNIRNLEQKVGYYLNKASQGRYSQVSISQDFAVTLRSKGKGAAWVALEQLSRGTMDMVCLALRLAICRFLSQDDHLPFFLDDVLINLDSARLLETVDVLERLSAEHQMILFSHDERLHNLACRRCWHVVALPGPRVKVTEKSKEGCDDGEQLSFL